MNSFADIFQAILEYSEYLLFTFRILRARIMQCTSQWMLLNKISNGTHIYFNSELRYWVPNFPSDRTNNTHKDFLIFQYFVSAFLSIHSHFPFIKVKTQNSLTLLLTLSLIYCFIFVKFNIFVQQNVWTLWL